MFSRASASLRALFALALILTVSRPVAAQYHIDTWTTDNGLPAADVSGVAQTPDGFLWIGTLGGLARFDGVNFRVFDTVTNPELPSSRIGPLVDGDGRLWVITQAGAFLHFDGTRFLPAGPADGLPTARVRRISVDHGHVVVETDAGTVVSRGTRFVPYTRPDPAGAAGMTFMSGTTLRRGNQDVVWYRDSKNVAYRFADGQLTTHVQMPGDIKERLYEDQAGRVWIADTKGNLLCFVNGDMHRYTPKDGIVAISTMWVSEDPDGTLWFAEEGGLVRFQHNAFRTFTQADGLPSSHVIAAQRDREGTLWVSTRGGLARLTEQPIASYTTANGLSSNNIYPILQDSRGDIWMGGWPGLTRMHDGLFETLPEAYGSRYNIMSLLEARDGALWIGTMGDAVRRVKDGHVTTLLDNRYVASAIYQVRDGDIWLGVDGGALRYHNGVFDPPLPGLLAVNTFYEDHAGALWIGSNDGLWRDDHGVLTHIDAAHGFTGTHVREIHAAANGALWIGTYDSGLFRYRDGVFTRFTTKEGLPTNGAFAILEDDAANFWISSNSGIYRVAQAELDDVAAGRKRRVNAVLYNRGDGMANQECNGLGRPAGIRTRDGRLWFATQGGVAIADPRRMAARPAPPLAILDVMTSGDAAPMGDRVEIKPGNLPSFDAHYTALTFVRPELVQFRYKMEGVDPDWSDPSTVRSAHYGRLPYGTFRFHVIAANRDGVWNEQGAGIAVVVIPPFYRTSWFLTMMIGVAGALALGAHRWRLGMIERRQAVQQAFARQLIDSQETDRRRIASELHDGVSQTLVVIKNWAQLGGQALAEDTAAKRKLGDIAGAAAQALGEVREVVQELVPYHLERLGLVAAIDEAAGRVSGASGIPITCALSDVNTRVSSETSLRLYRVVQEGLNNILKHSGAASASIEMVLEGGSVRLTIRDDGRGFDPAGVTPTETGHGFGLVGMGERSRMMSGALTIESAPGRGTTITIVVPALPFDSVGKPTAE